MSESHVSCRDSYGNECVTYPMKNFIMNLQILMGQALNCRLACNDCSILCLITNLTYASSFEYWRLNLLSELSTLPKSFRMVVHYMLLQEQYRLFEIVVLDKEVLFLFLIGSNNTQVQDVTELIPSPFSANLRFKHVHPNYIAKIKLF